MANEKRIYQMLIDNGVNYNKQNGEGKTPLHIAASMDSLAVATLLVGKGAKVRSNIKLHI